MIFALGFTMMLGPFAIDTYLPAFPLIAAALGVTLHDVSLSISVYMMGFALGQLTGGALSDRYGRRRVLATGLAVFALASFGLAQVQSLEALLWGRLLQSVGGGWIGVSVPALVRDRVQGVQAAKLFSMIGMVAIVAPAIAPAIGALLLEVGGWRLVFVCLGGYALCLFPLLQATVFRGPRKPPGGADGLSFLARYLGVLKTRSARPYIFWQAAAFGGLIIFVTYASYIYGAFCPVPGRVHGTVCLQYRRDFRLQPAQPGSLESFRTTPDHVCRHLAAGSQWPHAVAGGVVRRTGAGFPAGHDALRGHAGRHQPQYTGVLSRIVPQQRRLGGRRDGGGPVRAGGSGERAQQSAA